MGKKKKPTQTNPYEALDRDGYTAFYGLIEPTTVKTMRERVEELIEITPQTHANPISVPDLIDDDAVFDQAWSQPEVLGAIRHLLGDDARLGGVAVRALRPGNSGQELHADVAEHFVDGNWQLCHAICALVDFTEDNGATRVVPGSHIDPWKLKGKTDRSYRHPEQRQLLGPAGTIFVLNSHCGHSAGQNRSDHIRLALFSTFSRAKVSGIHGLEATPPPAERLQRRPVELHSFLS